MSAAIPRPPGSWRANARDDRLNPEEAAARAAVAAAAVRPPLDPAEDPRAQVRNLSPEQRLIRFQALVDQAGWKMSFVFDGDSARIEAFHPSRAAVMVTARAGRDRVNAYVLPPAVRDLPRWLSVRAASVEFFLTHLTLPPGQRHHPVTWLCKCPKTGRFPTESWAKHFMTDIAIHEGLRRYRGSALRRAYLCPDDNRVWHVTRRKKWYPPTDKDATA